jgi:hypothetical protein
MEALRRRVHQPIPEQGLCLKQVVTGFFNYHAVPANARALGLFRHHVTCLWRRSLRRRSQRDGFNRSSSRSAGSQSRAAEPARPSARTIDGELARRLSTQYSGTQLNYQPRGFNCLSDEVPRSTIYFFRNGPK